MIETHFSDRDLYFLGAGFLSAFFSIFLFARGKTKTALAVLILSAFLFRLLMALIDPFVHIWDEQYHALVAANMSETPFHPKLYREALLAYDPSDWTANHTWIHKPPLFLWQMVLSIKIFGINAFAIRLPSVVLAALMVPAIYRIGKICGSARTGFIAALILACSNMHINIVSGYLNTDQNDVVFSAYVLFSIWAWTEYVQNEKLRWVLLTGLFAAAAVLVKWLPGLLVFGGWGLAVILRRDWRVSFARWKHITIAMAVMLILAAPWFIYARTQWPAEWQAMQKGFRLHFEGELGHPGPWWYHFEALRWQFGWIFTLAIIPGFIIFSRRKISTALKIAFPAMVIAVFGFYSFVPARLPLFCFIVSPLLIVWVSLAAEEVLLLFENRTKRFFAPLSLLFLFIVSFAMVDIGRLEHFHTGRDPKEFYRKTRMANKAAFEKTAAGLPAKTVVFNCGGFNHVPFMFYTGLTAYNYIPSGTDIETIRSKNRKVAVFDDGHLPDYIVRDSSLIILHEPLVRNGF